MGNYETPKATVVSFQALERIAGSIPADDDRLRSNGTILEGSSGYDTDRG